MTIRDFRRDGTGIQLQTAQLIPRLRARGIETVVVSGRGAGQPRHETIEGSPVVRSPIPGSSTVASLAFGAIASSYVRRHHDSIDIVHALGGRHAAATVGAAARHGIPALVKVSRAGTMQDLRMLGRAPLGNRRADHILERAWFVCQSSNVRRELAEMGVPAERMFDIPNGVDVEHFTLPSPEEKRALRARLGWGDEVVVVSSGRLVAVKRIDVLLHALAGVTGTRLVILGSGSEEANLAGLAQRLGLNERVSFIGFTPEVSDYLRAADVFAHPSDSEGLSNSLLEALASGLPAVVTPVLDNDELAGEDGSPLIVAAHGDAAVWTRALADLVQDPGRRAELGAGAARLVRERLTLDHTAAKLVDAYQNLLR